MKIVYSVDGKSSIRECEAMSWRRAVEFFYSEIAQGQPGYYLWQIFGYIQDREI